jgi:hypothetical protein
MTDAEWAKVRHFKFSEFDSPDAAGSGLTMDREFVARLDLLRDRWGKPIPINSGFRTMVHNALVGGKPNSAHLRGKAADCEMSGLTECIRFALQAAYLGFRRIGIDKKGRFVHIDSDDALPQQAVWFYSEDTFA